MPQLLLIALVGAGLWLGWKALKKEMVRVDRELHDREPASGQTVELEKDPETGVYKPKNGRG
ncbi:MAG: hypothetical protein R3D02_13050 [Hyphomicrobiales bacterium]